MGQSSELSRGSWKESITTKVEDTLSASVGALIEVYVKDTESVEKGKDEVELKKDYVTINGSKMTFEEINSKHIADFYKEIVKESNIPQDFKEYFNTVHAFKRTGEESLNISSRVLNDENGDKIIVSNIFSNGSNIKETTSDFYKEPITRHLTDNGFLVNPSTMSAMALFHELGHYVVYKEIGIPEASMLDSYNEQITKIFKPEFRAKEIGDMKVSSLNEKDYDAFINKWYELDSALYREFPQERFCDDFAIQCMKSFMEADGSLKEDMPETFDIPNISYEDLFPDPSHYAEIYQEYILEQDISTDYAGLEDITWDEVLEKFQDREDFEDISKYIEFADKFDKFQEQDDPYINDKDD